MVGCTPEVMRRHYERMDQMAIATRNLDRRYAADGKGQVALSFLRRFLRGANRHPLTPRRTKLK